ncbi:MAG: hypothetical protein Q9M36_08420 [Sulfurovum sp.]|nr:hypothetical protein [Sulfurovum sp.]
MAEFSYILKQKFLESFDTLKNTSYDKENSVYMCQSELLVVDFDKVTRVLNPKKQPSSYDTLIVEEKDKKVFCVEFKNQKESDISNINLHKKVKNSEDTFKQICLENNINKGNYTFVLCIVYKSTPSKYRYRRFKENIIHFQLEQYKGEYVDEIITNDSVFFKKEFQKSYDEC